MAPSPRDAQDAQTVVLVVDDDPQVRVMLGYALRQHGLQAEEASSGEEALHALKRRKPDVVLLDVLMPGLDGLETCKRIRQQSLVPVIMLTALGRQDDVVAGLKAGADDYCAKPVNLSELAARIRAQLRRRELQAVSKPADVLTAGEGDLVIDVRGGQVLVKGRAVRLSPREFRLLHRLAQTPGRAVSQKALLAFVGGPSQKGSLLRTYIHRLRRKIELDPHSPRYILARARTGYVLRDQSGAATVCC
jgi:DNA-binding response OmpR family regulator